MQLAIISALTVMALSGVNASLDVPRDDNERVMGVSAGPSSSTSHPTTTAPTHTPSSHTQRPVVYAIPQGYQLCRARPGQGTSGQSVYMVPQPSGSTNGTSVASTTCTSNSHTKPTNGSGNGHPGNNGSHPGAGNSGQNSGNHGSGHPPGGNRPYPPHPGPHTHNNGTRPTNGTSISSYVNPYTRPSSLPGSVVPKNTNDPYGKNSVESGAESVGVSFALVALAALLH